jgi:DNA-binding NarL/FixJ family response regulator
VLSESYQSPLVPLFEEFLHEALDAAKEALGCDAFAAAWTEGQAMSLEESIAEGFAVEARPPAAPSMPGAPRRQDSPFAELTPAEIRVLRLLCGGLTTKEIAAQVVVSVSTVDRHLTHIYGKLGVRNRAEATALALTRGLV